MFVLVASHFSLGILLRLNLFFSHVHPHCFMVVCFFLQHVSLFMGKTIRCSVVVFNCHDYQGVSLTLNHQVLMLSVFKKTPVSHIFPGKNRVFSTKPPLFHIFSWKKSCVFHKTTIFPYFSLEKIVVFVPPPSCHVPTSGTEVPAVGFSHRHSAAR